MLQEISRPTQATTVSFTTAASLARLLSFDGQLLAVKTTPGRLNGELRIVPGQNDLCLSVTTNQPIFICGIKNKSTTAFSALDSSNENHSGIFRNFSNNLSEIATQVLVGFSADF